MYIYNKYIIRKLLPILFIVTLVVTSIVWIVQTMNLSKLIDQGIALTAFIKLTFLLLPYFIFIIMPIISVLSVIFLYHKLQEERKLVVLRSAGLSNLQIAKPALYLCVVISIILYYISLHLLPISYSNLKTTIGNFKEKYISHMITEKTFNQLSKYTTLYIDKKRAKTDFSGVLLFDNQSPGKRIIFFAKEGKIKAFGPQGIAFELFAGVQHTYDKSGNINKLHFNKINVNIAKPDDSAPPRTKGPFELFIHEMIWPSQVIASQQRNRLIVDGHVRLVWPFCNFAFVFLALSIFLRYPASRKTNFTQYAACLIPIIFLIYTHFSLQKMIYYNIEYLYLLYANIALALVIGTLCNWQSRI